MPYNSLGNSPNNSLENSISNASLGFETPIRLYKNIITKMEAWQPGSSHKARAARYMIQAAIAQGDLEPNTDKRIIEKSGGNLGVGLAYAAAQYGIGVDLVIGLSFSRIKKQLCEHFGARVIKEDWLSEKGMTPKEVIQALTCEQDHNYFFTDQFSNKANARAHLQETGPEFVAQIKPHVRQDQQIILVKGAGTGASFNGIIRALKEFSPQAKSCLVVPDNCDVLKDVYADHKLEGFCVGTKPPFLDLETVDKQFFVSTEQASSGQNLMAQNLGFYPGMTSGANYYAATKIAQQNPDALVLTLAYDSGESYLSVQPAQKNLSIKNAA